MAEQKPFIKIYHRYVHNKKKMDSTFFTIAQKTKQIHIDDLLKSRTFRRLKCKRKKRQKNDIIYPIS